MTTTSWMKALPAAALMAAFAAATPALAQTRSMAEIASYQGPDRTQRLIDGAKKEGTVSVYGSSVADDMRPIIEGFKKKYGIDFEYWRASSENLVQRTVQETRAGRCTVDAFASVAVELEALHREKLLQAVKSPLLANLIPQALRPHGEWVASRLNLFSAAYNTNLVKKDELPKSFEDLKDPRWRGRLAVEADDSDWFATIVTKMGRDKGVQLFKDIVKTNGFSIRKGHTLLANLVAAGEVPLALDTYSYKPEQQKRSGAPVEPLYLAARHRARLRAGGRQMRAASQCGRPVLRFHARRRAADVGQARHGGDQPEDRIDAARHRTGDDRSRRHARQSRQVGRALDQHRPKAEVKAYRLLGCRPRAGGDP